VLAGVVNIMNSIFCGYLIASQNIPSFWIFMYYLSPLHYALEGLVFSQAHGDRTPVTSFSGTVITAEEGYAELFS